MGALLLRKRLPVCISLGAITVAQALSVHATVKQAAAGTGQRPGDTNYSCEDYPNASGWGCLQLVCQQVRVLTLIDTVLHLVDLL